MTADTISSIDNLLKRLENWIAAHRLLFLLLLIAFLGFLFLITWAAYPAAAPKWTGFGEVKTAGGEVTRTTRTLWDWLQLLLVPAFLAGAAAWIVRSQKNRELERNKVDREIAEQARQDSLDNAEKARESDREISRGRQDQLTLENYYDRMADLLLNHDLRSKTADRSEERTVARARTVAVLRSLDVTKKGQVIQYLYESDLIANPDPVIMLDGADLSGAHLVSAHLERANINKANLKGADLRMANLERAYMDEINLADSDLFEANLRQAKLNYANLSGANLRLAVLTEADLMCAQLLDTSLHSAQLRKANLREANLNNANLSRARLNGACLSNASLKQANLSQARMSHASLIKANLVNSLLEEADLLNVDLSGANLRGALLKEVNLAQAYLSAADLTLADLSGAIYSSQTIWPDGFDPTAAGAILVDDGMKSTVETDEEE